MAAKETIDTMDKIAKTMKQVDLLSGLEESQFTKVRIEGEDRV